MFKFRYFVEPVSNSKKLRLVQTAEPVYKKSWTQEWKFAEAELTS